ncbi:hypothetical protein [Brevibacillus sp. SIMBA_040]|uniref:hypothetical protein n=1 Tax=unclassified Brevibacillus TaxID=2684853 RepID=UPI00397D3D93
MGGGEEKGEKAPGSWDTCWMCVLLVSMKKAKTASKVVGAGCGSGWTLKSLFSLFSLRLGWFPKDLCFFSFFLSQAVGITRAF